MCLIIATGTKYLIALIKQPGGAQARHKSVLELAIGMLAAGEADTLRLELQDSHHFRCA